MYTSFLNIDFQKMSYVHAYIIKQGVGGVGLKGVVIGFEGINLLCCIFPVHIG